MRSQTHRTALIVAIAALLVSTPFVGLAGASSGSVTAIIASPANGAVHTRIGDAVFTDGSTHASCPVTSWRWSFGDGATSTLQDPQHRYAALGTYPVTLTVTGACGATSTASISLVVQNIRPSASASASPSPVVAGSSLTLGSSASRDLDGTIVEYRYSLDGVAFPPQAAPTLATTAPTLAGSHTVSLVVVDNDGGVSAPSTTALQVAPGPLDSITVSGPATMTVGTTVAFVPTGYDAYGNPVALAQAQFNVTAPDAPGTITASYTESGVTGAMDVSVLSDELARIAVSGPGTLVANTSGTYALAGFDRYDNPVALSQGSVEHLAATAAGPAMVCFSEGSVSGCQAIMVVADALDSIALSGPDTLAAGALGVYDVAGFDRYGNPVALAVESVSFSEETAGPATVSHAEAGVTGALDVAIVPAPLHRISVTGPTTVVADTTRSYSLAGFDAYDNPVVLAQTSLAWTAPTEAGTYTVTYTEGSVTGSLMVEVVFDQLFQLFVEGPAFPVAGSSVVYTFHGIDQHGNAVTLDPTSRAFVLPSAVGVHDVCEEQQGIIGCLTVDVVAGAVATIIVTGPGALVANTSATYSVAGYDEHGNPTPLARSSFVYTAPSTAGPASASYTEGGVTGTRAVTVVADALASIVLTGPTNVVAGSTNAYAANGYDRYGNGIRLADETPTFVAPTLAGPAAFAHTEGNVTGSIDVTVTHAALHAISVSGPASLVAATLGEFALAGADEYGNPVPLAQSTLSYTAPSAVGAYTVAYAEGDVTGATTVDVVPDVLHTLQLSGPTQVAAGSVTPYAITGFDRHGNGVALSQTSIDLLAPTEAGQVDVSYEEAGVSVVQTVDVVASSLARISISGPRQMVAGSTASFGLAGYDSYGNVVALPDATFEHTAPTTLGEHLVTYTHEGVTGSKAVRVVDGLPAYILVDGPASLMAGATGTYAVAGYDVDNERVTLAVESFDFTAPSQVGLAQACYVESGVEGCADVEVVAATLARIEIDGPTTLVVNTTQAFSARGFDEHGNDVPLGSAASFDFTAPTLAGPITVTHTVGNVTDTLEVVVIAGELAAILMTGPASLVAGAEGTYALAGVDEFGNAVPLAQESLLFRAPPAAGVADVCYAEGDVDECLAIEVLPDALASILVSGEQEPVAGTTQTYALAGFDQYGNDVQLAQPSLEHAVPTVAGPASVSYTESGITGTLSIVVVADALASIALAGPTTLVAGELGEYALSGADQYGNPVELLEATTTFGSTTAGPAQVAYEERGVVGALHVDVLPAGLARIALDGPDTLVAGLAASYALARFDVYDNPVALEETALEVLLTKAGPATVSYTEDGILGEKEVVVAPAALARVEIEGPTQLAVTQSATYAFRGFDAYENPVALAEPTRVVKAPATPGELLVCSADLETACLTVVVVEGPPVAVVVSSPATQLNLGRTVALSAAARDANGNDLDVPLVWSASRGEIDQNGLYRATRTGRAAIEARAGNVTGATNITVVGTLNMRIELEREWSTGERVNGTVVVTFVDGAPVAGAPVTVSIDRALTARLGLGTFTRTTLSGTTDANGRLAFAPPSGWATPDEYVVAASAVALGNTGAASARYTVTP